MCGKEHLDGGRERGREREMERETFHTRMVLRNESIP